MLQTQTVTADTLALTKQLMANPRLNDFVLVGGTALALTIGHRHSIDIDLFTQNSFDTHAVADMLKTDYGAEYIKTFKNSVICVINGIKTDLIGHPYPEVEPHKTVDGIRIMSLPDIAAMKLHAIVQSGSRIKDFADIYFLLEHMPLSKMYAAYEGKYHPDASRAVARIALNDTSHVNIHNEIILADRLFEWVKIKERLRTAIEFYDRKFASSKSQAVKEEERKKKNRGMRP